MTPLYIFDLDGTLALIEHRRHFVENRANRWDEFHAGCVDDEPNWPVIRISQMLRRAGSRIVIFSGRSGVVEGVTRDWLFSHDILYSQLVMRRPGDYTPDDVLKRSWYEAMTQEDKDRLVAVFDDRDRIVKMWRSLGIVCLQVAPGDF